MQSVELPRPPPQLPNPTPPTGIDYLTNIVHNNETKDDFDFNATVRYSSRSKARVEIDKAMKKNTAKAGSACDSTYMYVFKKYKEFVIKKRNEGVLEKNGKFITRDGVDLYFSQVVAHKTVMPDTAKRIKPALKYYENRVEYTGCNKFDVNSDSVVAALGMQSLSYMEYAKKQINDPHANLPTKNINLF